MISLAYHRVNRYCLTTLGPRKKSDIRQILVGICRILVSLKRRIYPIIKKHLSTITKRLSKRELESFYCSNSATIDEPVAFAQRFCVDNSSVSHYVIYSLLLSSLMRSSNQLLSLQDVLLCLMFLLSLKAPRKTYDIHCEYHRFFFMAYNY